MCCPVICSNYGDVNLWQWGLVLCSFEASCRNALKRRVVTSLFVNDRPATQLVLPTYFCNTYLHFLHPFLADESQCCLCYHAKNMMSSRKLMFKSCGRIHFLRDGTISLFFPTSNKDYSNYIAVDRASFYTIKQCDMKWDLVGGLWSLDTIHFVDI